MLALCAGLAVALPHHTAACAFHGYTPNPTLVDMLLGTEQVALARLAPGDPTRFRVTETLAGPPVSDPPLTPQSRTRQKLAGDTRTQVLIARDGAYGPWRELAVLDPEYHAVIRQVMHHQPAWQLGDDSTRLAFFARFVNAAAPDLRQLALDEMDRVSYASLKAQRLPAVAGLRRALQDGSADRQPVLTLLAGLSGDGTLAPLVRNGLDRAVRDGSATLGAYVVALIELEGAPAVRDIAARHLAAPGLAPVTRDRLLQAMAIQYRNAAAPVRRAIAQQIAQLSRTSPEMASAAAAQFGSVSRWRGTDTPTRPATTGSGPER